MEEEIGGREMTSVEEALKSLDAWHSDKIRGHKVYFADAVKIALRKVSLNKEANK